MSQEDYYTILNSIALLELCGVVIAMCYIAFQDSRI